MTSRRRPIGALIVAVLAGAPLLSTTPASVAAPLTLSTPKPSSIASSAGSTAPAALTSSTAAPSASTPGARARAYEATLASAQLAGPGMKVGDVTPYTPEEISAEVDTARRMLFEGRAADVSSRLLALVESKRFELVSTEPEARAAMLVLGQAFAEQGISKLARDYFRKAASGPTTEATARAATRRLTEIALENEDFASGVDDLTPIVDRAPTSPELRGELDFVLARKLESEGDIEGARAVYARIESLSRFWSAATYRRGLIAVDDARFDEAEQLFCAVADPKRQDQSAPIFADDRFFAVRDLARLALGRVAHEELRHDDARFYYYLVPQDSRRLAEALYEGATTRYEAADYDGARELLDELSALGAGHVYDDEARVLDVYVDIAQCKMTAANGKLDAFLEAYVPMRARVHELVDAPDADLRAFLERGASLPTTASEPSDPTAAAASAKAKVDAAAIDARIIARLEADPALVFVLRARRRLAAQLAGTTATVKQIDGLAAALSPTSGAPTTLHAAIDPDTASATSLASTERTVRDAIDGIRAELQALERAGAPHDQTSALRTAIGELEAKVREASAGGASAPIGEAKTATGTLGELLGDDRKLATSIAGQGAALLVELDRDATLLARDALRRLDHRASRLVARAKLAKIDVVLGRKKGLEIEVESLRQGVLPASALDSLQAQRFLGDNEEWWPFEGDEWTDEVVGSEQK
ncbi:MAG: hypothetical protein ACHREM_03300 [Polyangiales bacterium]